MITVFTVITTSGAGLINTIWLLIFSTILLIYEKPVLEKKAAIWLGMWVCFLGVNTVFGGGGSIVGNEFLIMALRLICVTVVLSNITINEFLNIFIVIMEPMAILSLINFAILVFAPGIVEPFCFVSGNIKGTLVQVSGFVTEAKYTRNCGIFWEPGVYQIYLNLAIMLLIFQIISDIPHKNRKIIILAITLLTTQSSMGLLCFAITLFSASFMNSAGYNKTTLRVVAFFSLLGLVLIEANYSIIGYKILQGGGSFSARMEDMRIAASITRSYPILGTGILRDYSKIWIAHRQNIVAKFWGELANSNGLGASFFKMGIPFTVLNLSFIYVNYYRLCKKKVVIAIVMFINTVLFFMNEPIIFVPFWIIMASWAWNDHEETITKKSSWSQICNARRRNVVRRTY